MRERWSLHDFQVLLVLGGGAGGYLVEPFGDGGLFECVPAGEGGEELVVAAPAAGRDVAAHGEGVDELVVEGLIGEGVGGRDEWLGAGRRDELEGIWVDAEVFLDGLGEKGFGVDGAGEMHVEVGALGEGLEEGIELAGAKSFGGVKGAGGAGFAEVGGVGGGLILCDGAVGQRGEGEGESDASADHDPVPFECFELSKDTAGGWPRGDGFGAWAWGLLYCGSTFSKAPSTDEAVIPS